MTVKEIQEKILKLKKEKDVCIIAHVYQGPEILEIADFTGDSFLLSVKAGKTKNKNVIMCGVRFMAETCKILCPDKKVYLANPVAGCPMAEQMSLKELSEMKKKYPDHAVVAYVNTTAELKSACDVCVTSASAVKICREIENDKILFIPDPNLGDFVKKQIPEKDFVFFNGGCPRHFKMTAEDVKKAREAHPDALFLVHPECPPEVVEGADYAGSTTGIMDFAAKSAAEEFIIGTENSIVGHLQYAHPEKCFYPLSVRLSCMDMRVTTLMDVYHALTGGGGEEILLSEEILRKARTSIERMIELGG